MAAIIDLFFNVNPQAAASPVLAAKRTTRPGVPPLLTAGDGESPNPLTLRLWFYDGVPGALTSTNVTKTAANMILRAKLSRTSASPSLVLATAFTEITDIAGDKGYEADLDLNTVELLAATDAGTDVSAWFDIAESGAQTVQFKGQIRPQVDAGGTPPTPSEPPYPPSTVIIADQAENESRLTALEDGKVAKAGDTMTGQLTLPGGGTGSQAITVSETNTALALKQSISEKGAADGYASLDGSGKVPAAQLPSYVDDVVEANDFAALPVTGETGKIYVTIDTGRTYRWSGSAYVEISNPSPASETVSGILEVATDAEVTTGTDDTRAVSPKKLATRLASWLSTLFGNGTDGTVLIANATGAPARSGVTIAAANSSAGATELARGNDLRLMDSEAATAGGVFWKAGTAGAYYGSNLIRTIPLAYRINDVHMRVGSVSSTEYVLFSSGGSTASDWRVGRYDATNLGVFVNNTAVGSLGVPHTALPGHRLCIRIDGTGANLAFSAFVDGVATGSTVTTALDSTTASNLGCLGSSETNSRQGVSHLTHVFVVNESSFSTLAEFLALWARTTSTKAASYSAIRHTPTNWSGSGVSGASATGFTCDSTAGSAFQISSSGVSVTGVDALRIRIRHTVTVNSGDSASLPGITTVNPGGGFGMYSIGSKITAGTSIVTLSNISATHLSGSNIRYWHHSAIWPGSGVNAVNYTVAIDFIEEIGIIANFQPDRVTHGRRWLDVSGNAHDALPPSGGSCFAPRPSSQTRTIVGTVVGATVTSATVASVGTFTPSHSSEAAAYASIRQWDVVSAAYGQARPTNATSLDATATANGTVTLVAGALGGNAVVAAATVIKLRHNLD